MAWNDNNVKDTVLRGHADADGNETVEVWECHPDCSVKALDEQSGVLKSGKPGIRRNAHDTIAMSGRLSRTGKTEMGVGDTGGASRFFKQIEEFKCQSKNHTE